MDIFMRELKNVVGSIVFKQNKEASKYETLEIRQKADVYIMVKDGLDDFSSYVNFDTEVYRKAGIPEHQIFEYQKDKALIPYGLRDVMISLQREKILADYTEKNNYYRMLSGLPDIEDLENIYVPENDYSINTKIPVHLLGSTDMARLYGSGIIKTLIAQYPKKKYLQFLGEKSISWHTARKALNYELLRYDMTEPDIIGLDFKRFYSYAREYFMTAVYNSSLSSIHKYYDNIIGMFILVMATQRTIAEVYKQGITRDFYDVQLIRYLFNSYNIPFIEEMTMDQMKLLAKNLNIFLSYKSTTKGIFNICSIFGFSNVNIYKYFLVKNHLTDEKGMPIFEDITIANGDGTFDIKPNYQRMYDIYFQKINVMEEDINAELENPTNRVDYTSMTVNDPYWCDDDALREKIYESAYNHIETKYLSLDIMFKITEMMYEICHVFRMIMDNNKEFKKISIDVPKISSKQQDLFSIVIFLCALFCKRYNFKGNIPLKPESIAYVYGFNFRTDLDKIISDILSTDNKYIDRKVVNYMINFTVANSKDVGRIYKNIKDLKDFIVERMAETKNIDSYRAYKALYKSVLIVQDSETVYKKKDGTCASTYADLLKDINPELWGVYNNLSPTDKATSEVFTHLLYKLEELSSEFKYLHLAVESQSLFGILVKLINFFKSYTVHLSSAGLLYLFDDRYFNMMKILDKINSIEVKMEIKDVINALYIDLINVMQIEVTEKEAINIKDQLSAVVKYYINERLYLKDNVYWETSKDLSDAILTTFADTFSANVTLSEKEIMAIVDRMQHTIINILNREYIKFVDKLKSSDVIMREISNLLLLDDRFTDTTMKHADMMNLRFKDLIKSVRIVSFNDGKLIVDAVCTILSIVAKENNLISMDYIFTEEVDYPIASNISLIDSLDISRSI